ncbi:hypothetical protein CQ054_05880 [Ochrobactrum sp. MYb29]|nr:hypothetical protein CQ054_05880 [Ochrobactrum sp. MYb29]
MNNQTDSAAKARAKADADEKAQLEAEAKAKAQAEADEKARLEAEAKAQTEAAAKLAQDLALANQGAEAGPAARCEIRLNGKTYAPGDHLPADLDFDLEEELEEIGAI